MKKITAIAIAAIVCAVFMAPAWAADFEFKGMWRTRGYMTQNFTGEDKTEELDVQLVDTRTRLQLNALINENLKLINQFEMDATWGDAANYGDIDTDGKVFEIKHSYADFTMDVINAKVGAQPVYLARGFLLDCDAAGLTLAYKAENMEMPFIWAKHTENSEAGVIDDNDGDVDYYIVSPKMTMGEMSVNPYLMAAMSKENDLDFGTDIEDFAVYALGVDVDAKMDAITAWATAIYEMGSLSQVGGDDVDLTGWLVALGGDFGLSDMMGIHGQVFAASGQDPDEEDGTAFINPDGASYYWAEIMGYGIFDNYSPKYGAPADQISDIMAVNAGITVSPMDKLSISADVWYAQLMEDDANGNTDLGTEIDVVATYTLVENLNLDVVAAYLLAGDATTMESNDEADPIEIGTRLQLKF